MYKYLVEKQSDINVKGELEYTNNILLYIIPELIIIRK